MISVPNKVEEHSISGGITGIMSFSVHIKIFVGKFLCFVLLQLLLFTLFAREAYFIPPPPFFCCWVFERLFLFMYRTFKKSYIVFNPVLCMVYFLSAYYLIFNFCSIFCHIKVFLKNYSSSMIFGFYPVFAWFPWFIV